MSLIFLTKNQNFKMILILKVITYRMLHTARIRIKREKLKEEYKNSMVKIFLLRIRSTPTRGIILIWITDCTVKSMIINYEMQQILIANFRCFINSFHLKICPNSNHWKSRTVLITIRSSLEIFTQNPHSPA